MTDATHEGIVFTTEVSLVNWTRIPDLVCAILMIWTFGSVSRDKQNRVSSIWMLAWVMILVHSIAALFTQIHGIWGGLVYIVFSVALAWAGLLFCHASMARRDRPSSRWMLLSLAAASFVYMTVLCLSSSRPWAMNLAAVLVTLCPLTVVLASLRSVQDRRTWAVLAVCAALSIFLLAVQNQRPYGITLAWNGYLFAAYFGTCCFSAWTHRRATPGTIVTITGFFGWSLVYILEPLQQARWPLVHIESEIWHLPAFVVAMGMLLMLFEDQLKTSKHLALHDELTGLPNRRLFQDRLENALARARRTGEPLGLLSIDLDEFKQVNDTLGHQAGDTLLRQVSALFASRTRRSDTVARTGGDEFCVILENPAGRADADHVAEAIRSLLHQPIPLGDHSIRVGASIGVAIFPEDGMDADSLCRVADLRMYAVKHGIEQPEKRPSRSAPDSPSAEIPSPGAPAAGAPALSQPFARPAD